MRTTKIVGCGIGLFVIALSCARGAPRTAGDSSSAALPAPPATAAPAPSASADVGNAGLVVITLRRDSLGVAATAPLDSTRAAMQRVLARLQRSNDFEVLDLSPAVLAARVRRRGSGDAAALALALRKDPAVAAAEVEGIARKTPR